jgi:spore coat polysaccharide biosynthesis protein SpsF
MKNICLGIIIFARLGSKRLPKKVLKKIGHKSLLEITIERAKKVKRIDKIVIASPNTEIDRKKISEIAKKNKIYFFCGSNKNVYLRAKNCCERYNFTHFIRLNADRPFFDYDLANYFTKKRFFNYDLVTNNLKKNAPKGLTMELIKFKNFEKFKNMTKNEKEHICNYFYNKPKKFKILNVNKKIYNINKNLSLGVDNKEDLFLTRKIFKTFNFNYLINLKKIILHYKKLINKDEIYKHK